MISDGAYGFQHVNVAQQRRDPNSLLNWMERMIRMRKEVPEIGWGDFSFLNTRTTAVFAMRYDWRNNAVLCLHNMTAEPKEIRIAIDQPDEAACSLVNLLSDDHSRSGEQMGATAFFWSLMDTDGIAFAGSTTSSSGPRLKAFQSRTWRSSVSSRGRRKALTGRAVHCATAKRRLEGKGDHDTFLQGLLQIDTPLPISSSFYSRRSDFRRVFVYVVRSSTTSSRIWEAAMKLGSMAVLTLSFGICRFRSFFQPYSSGCVGCFCRRREPMCEVDESNRTCACA